MQSPIVIDTGSGTCKAGFAYEPSPRAIVQNVTAHPSQKMVNMDPKLENVRYVGHEAFSKRSIFKLRYPVEKGMVADWDSMEVLWHHVYDNELCCRPEDHLVLQTESPTNPLKNKNTMLEILFDRFNVPALYFDNTATLALYASGRTTGVLLDSGQDSTSCVAVLEGKVLLDTLEQTDLAGKALTEYLRIKMMERGVPWINTSHSILAGEVKERFCYVSPNFASEVERFAKEGNALRKPCDKSEGQQIFIEQEQFQVGEALFTPSVTGLEATALDRMVFDTISKAPEAIRPTLYQNIALAGGTTLMPGLALRLQRGLELRSPKGTEIKIIEPPNRQFSAWIGGTQLASLPTFKESWVTKQQYLERGSNVEFNFSYTDHVAV